MIRNLTDTPEKEAEFEKLRKTYHNEATADMVKKINVQYRIIELDDELIQKVYPIYMDPEPKHLLDFRAQFYTPKKHLASLYFDTLYFNVFFIWFMSVVLYITLYYDVFRKIVNLFSKVPAPNRFRGN